MFELGCLGGFLGYGGFRLMAALMAEWICCDCCWRFRTYDGYLGAFISKKRALPSEVSTDVDSTPFPDLRPGTRPMTRAMWIAHCRRGAMQDFSLLFSIVFGIMIII